MTVIAVTAAQVAPVFPDKAEIYTAICAETITAGTPLYVNTSGKVEPADANAAGEQQCRYLALEGGGAGQAISVLRRGHVYGFTLSQAYDAPVFLSDTVGRIDDAAGTLEVPLGIVAAIPAGPNINKVLYFEPRFGADYA